MTALRFDDPWLLFTHRFYFAAKFLLHLFWSIRYCLQKNVHLTLWRKKTLDNESFVRIKPLKNQRMCWKFLNFRDDYRLFVEKMKHKAIEYLV